MTANRKATTGNEAIPGAELKLLGPASSVHEGSMRTFALAGEEILVANIEGEYFGVDNMCSHALGWLDEGFLHPQTFEVECALHSGRFDLRSGKATRLPCMEPIATYRIIRRGENLFVAPADS